MKRLFKLLLSLLFVLSLTACADKDRPIVVLKEDVTFEFGQTSDKVAELFDTIVAEDFVDLYDDNNKFDKVSFNDFKDDKSDNVLVADAVGEFETVIYAKNKESVKKIKVKYKVVDTEFPVIEGDSDYIHLLQGEGFDVSKYFTAYDVMDGPLEVKAESLNVNTIAEHNVTLTAEDSHNNISTKVIVVNVKPVLDTMKAIDSIYQPNSATLNEGSNYNHNGVFLMEDIMFVSSDKETRTFLSFYQMNRGPIMYSITTDEFNSQEGEVSSSIKTTIREWIKHNYDW